MPITHIFAFDVEATGGNLQTHFCPEFGAALVEVESGKELWRFHTFVAQPTDRIWDQQTLSDFWLSKVPERYALITAAQNTAPSAADAMRKFVTESREAIRVHVPGGVKSVVVVSDTAGFDCAWMDSMMPLDAAQSMRHLLDPNVSRPLRDVHSVYLGISGYISSDDIHEALYLNGKKPSPYELACMALTISPIVTSVAHTHNPADDSSCMAQRAAHIVRWLQYKKCSSII